MTSTTGEVTIEAFVDYAARYARCELVHLESFDMAPAFRAVRAVVRGGRGGV